MWHTWELREKGKLFVKNILAGPFYVHSKNLKRLAFHASASWNTTSHTPTQFYTYQQDTFFEWISGHPFRVQRNKAVSKIHSLRLPNTQIISSEISEAHFGVCALHIIPKHWAALQIKTASIIAVLPSQCESSF